MLSFGWEMWSASGYVLNWHESKTTPTMFWPLPLQAFSTSFPPFPSPFFLIQGTSWSHWLRSASSSWNHVLEREKEILKRGNTWQHAVGRCQQAACQLAVARKPQECLLLQIKADGWVSWMAYPSDTAPRHPSGGLQKAGGWCFSAPFRLSSIAGVTAMTLGSQVGSEIICLMR